jgi:[acyl-carrier-protein] S-malonyltransferase
VERIGFLFAGQGSQYVGMGQDLYESFAESKAVFDKADKVLGFSLSGAIFTGTAESLKLTIISQPAILAVSIAAFEAFRARCAIKPMFVAGLSLGEYTALVAAGAFSFEDGLRLVRQRAEIMEHASRRYPGAMAAVLDVPLEKVKEICLQANAEIANINAPGQVVITGKVEAVKKASQLCQEGGAKRVIPLEVSGPFHSSLMREASYELKQRLLNTPLSTPTVPIVSNYTARPVFTSAQIAENLIRQMYSPVRWEESMRFILSEGITKFYEFGPGKVLKGLMRRIDPNIQVKSIEKKEDILGL